MSSPISGCARFVSASLRARSTASTVRPSSVSGANPTPQTVSFESAWPRARTKSRVRSVDPGRRRVHVCDGAPPRNDRGAQADADVLGDPVAEGIGMAESLAFDDFHRIGSRSSAVARSEDQFHAGPVQRCRPHRRICRKTGAGFSTALEQHDGRECAFMPSPGLRHATRPSAWLAHERRFARLQPCACAALTSGPP